MTRCSMLCARLWTLVLAMLVVAVPVMGQAAAATLVGLVRDSAGRPVPMVEVWLRGTDLRTHSADNGGFRLPGAPPGAVTVALRRMGFEPATINLQLRPGQIDSLVVSITRVSKRRLI